MSEKTSFGWPGPTQGTVDGRNLAVHQLRLVVYLIIYRVYISQVVSRISEPSTVAKLELPGCRTRRVHMRRISILPLTLWLVKTVFHVFKRRGLQEDERLMQCRRLRSKKEIHGRTYSKHMIQYEFASLKTLNYIPMDLSAFPIWNIQMHMLEFYFTRHKLTNLFLLVTLLKEFYPWSIFMRQDEGRNSSQNTNHVGFQVYSSTYI